MERILSQSQFANYGHAVLTLNALRMPDKIAIRHGAAEYSYAALNAEVNRFAQALLQAGVRPRDKVALLLGSPLHITRAYLALAKLGAVIVSLNPFWARDTLTGVLAHCRPAHLLFDAPHAATIAAAAPPAETLLWSVLEDTGIAAPGGERHIAAAAYAAQEPPLAAHGEDMLAYFFSSGTTGLPKPIAHSHASALAISRFLLDLPHDANSVYGTGPIIWGVGFPCIIGAALLTGMTVALEDSFDAANFLRAVQSRRITHCTLIPSMWADVLTNHPHQEYDLSSLRVLMLGGEPILPSLVARIKERVPDAGVYCFYGQTEAPYTCLGRLDDDSQPSDSVGQPRTGCALQVVDAQGEALTDCAGELIIAGPHRMIEYAGMPEKTASVLQDGWFHTGDLAQRDARGFVKIIGRKEDAIFRNGRYHRPAVIEEAALSLAGVREAGAVATPEQPQKIILAVVPDVALRPTVQQLQAQLRTLLPAELMPDLIVLEEQLPHGVDGSGGTGKLLRRVILERCAPLLAATAR